MKDYSAYTIILTSWILLLIRSTWMLLKNYYFNKLSLVTGKIISRFASLWRGL